MIFDLNLFSMTYTNGQLQPEVPAFFAASAIKRAARGRQEDALIILLNLKGDNPLPQDEQKDWLEKLSNLFFKTSGSVTSAMRLVIDSVNNALMERNLKLVSDHDRLSADLSLAVI
ncbi:MAG: hypothetical protein MUO40_09445, partial [Anaerolineaceae bacterium]|nr:hypothetical protein [Anaerolineaceae bacterium]